MKLIVKKRLEGGTTTDTGVRRESEAWRKQELKGRLGKEETG